MFVKIIASIGPSSGNIETIYNMVKEGVHGFRINFAHGDQNEWRRYVEAVREVETKLGRPIALIGDLEGPSLRLGKLSKPIVLQKGEHIKIVYGNEVSDSNENIVPMPISKFFEYIDVGDILIMDDGRTRLRVVDKGADNIEAIALTESIITSRKAVTIYGKELDLPALSDKDIGNIKFAIENDFDYIGLSYVRSSEDIDLLRDILKRAGREDIGIISKIETKSAIRNLSSILEKSDIVLVARGDLGMNFGLEEIHYHQRYIIEKALENRKPVIVATQLLESMTEKPVPTRAEVVDVSVAVEMGVDALMLTGETAVGKFPVEAVSWLNRIVVFVERHIMPKIIDKISNKAREHLSALQLKFAKGVLELAEDLNAKLFVFSMYGNTARRIATLKPKIPVYVASQDIKVLRKLSILWGLLPFHINANNYEEGLQNMLSKAIDLKLISYGDLVVLTYGLKEPRQKIEILRIMS